MRDFTIIDWIVLMIIFCVPLSVASMFFNWQSTEPKLGILLMLGCIGISIALCGAYLKLAKIRT